MYDFKADQNFKVLKTSGKINFMLFITIQIMS